MIPDSLKTGRVVSTEDLCGAQQFPPTNIYPVIQGDPTHERVMLDYTQDTQDWESFDSSQGKKS